MARLLDHVVSFVSWHRRLVGGLLAAGAVFLTIQVVAEPSAPTVPAAVLAADLQAGHTLTASDVEVRGLPPDLLPHDALPDAPVGSTLTTSLSAGTVLQPGLVTGGRPTEPGRAVVPISVPDERLRALLRPGDQVTLIVTAFEAAEVLTADARIAALPTQPDDSPIGLATSRGSDMVLVDVPAEQAAAVASHGQGGGLSVVLGTL